MLPILQANLPYLLKGAVYTVYLSVIVVVLGTLLGIVVGTVSTFAPTAIRHLITAYIFLFRGVPVLVVMFLGYYTFPAFGLRLDAYAAVAISMVIYTGAFVAEAMRGAIQALPRGQIDAGLSIGMRRGALLRHVILPQAMRLALVPILNVALMAIKQTSYASVVGAWELSFAAREVVERTLAAFQIFLGVMLVYFLICYPLSLLASHLEKKLSFDH
jgi:His/Glu/Gln/Arg/opine family amino acid ABC transporter permease subunit